MPTTSIVGLDTAKNVFQLHGVDSKGKATLRRRLRRAQLSDFFANFPACVIGLEATQGAHHWARVLETFGHTVRLVAPQFVKPYLQSQKNDAKDAAAICEAVSRPHMQFVPRKTVEQQDLQALHRVPGRVHICPQSSHMAHNRSSPSGRSISCFTFSRLASMKFSLTADFSIP